MKKLYTGLFCVLLIFNISGCIPLTYEMYILQSLPAYDKEVTNYSDGFQDYTDYCKYYYTDENIIDRVKNNDNFYLVDENNIEEVKLYFEDHSGWGKMHFEERYDFPMDCINEGDYYSLYIPEEYQNPSEKLWSYSMFYLDKESLTLYYIHNNI